MDLCSYGESESYMGVCRVSGQHVLCAPVCWADQHGVCLHICLWGAGYVCASVVRSDMSLEVSVLCGVLSAPGVCRCCGSTVCVFVICPCTLNMAGIALWVDVFTYVCVSGCCLCCSLS